MTIIEENDYLNNRMKAMCLSKIMHFKSELRHYFKNRHVGLAGIDAEMTSNLCRNAILNYKLWLRVNYYTQTKKHYY